jgi:hypothetical protein
VLLQGQYELARQRRSGGRPAIRERLFVRQMDAAMEVPQLALTTVEERSKT